MISKKKKHSHIQRDCKNEKIIKKKVHRTNRGILQIQAPEISYIQYQKEN